MTEDAFHPIIRSSTPMRMFDNLGEVAAVATFPDRRRLATNSKDGMLRVWDLKDGVMLKEMDGHGEAMADMALSRDGRLIAISDDGGHVNAWHGDTGRPLTRAFSAHSEICSLDFSPDGATLATSSSDLTVNLWSTATWQLQGQLTKIGPDDCYGGSVNCIRYSLSGELLAIATSYGIEIWNPATKCRIADLKHNAMSLVWTPDGTRLLSGGDTIREWDSSTWKQVHDIWKGHTSHPWKFAVNCNGTVLASPTTDNHVRLWRLSDWRTIAIFRHPDSPCCVTFSMDGKHILVGGNDKKISEWAVPAHAWPEDAPNDQATHQAQDCNTEAQDCNTEAQDSDTKAQAFDTDAQGSGIKDKNGYKNKQKKQTKTQKRNASMLHIITMDTAVRKACISGDLPTAEKLLTQKIDANGDSCRSYANRSVVMARRLDWDNALRDATKSISIQPSLMGYISKGIALFGMKQVGDATQAFDLAFTFTDGDSKINHFLSMIKAIALFHANKHADAMRRIHELAAACPDGDTNLACRVIEVYLYIQLGNNALDRSCPAEAANHFTSAVNACTFLNKSDIHSKYDGFVVLFGCDLMSLWQTANQKRCHALLRAGRLGEVFEACRYMADMSSKSMKARCLDWTIGFMQELNTFRDHASNVDATPDMCKYDENDSISDIDSDIDHVDDVVR